jgi:hypothetical protein
MAKSTKTSDTAPQGTKPAVRRSRTTKTPAAPAPRRTASGRSKKVADVSDDRGLSAAVAAGASLPVAGPEPTHDEIAGRAYFIHLRHQGGSDPVNDWMQAVAELRSERGLI